MKTSFNKMSESTQQDWHLIMSEQMAYFSKLPDRILTHLSLLDNDYGGFPVDRLQHSLQTAELAANAGEDDEYVVCALLHDIGDTLGSANHPDVAAAILQPFVSEENHWMVKHHGIFQGYNFFHYIGLERDLKDKLIESEFYQRTERFVNLYDDLAFDNTKPKLSLNLFEKQVRKVFSDPKNSVYRKAL